jgi:hypothetical protein
MTMSKKGAYGMHGTVDAIGEVWRDKLTGNEGQLCSRLYAGVADLLACHKAEAELNTCGASDFCSPVISRSAWSTIR